MAQTENETLETDAEAAMYKKRALELIERSTGLKRLEEILREPFKLDEKRAA